MKINQAVIMCAGLGTRLRPYTDAMPKVMTPILGKPLLMWHVESFRKYGVKEFFINLHYLPDAIKNYLGDGSKLNVKINYSFEPDILGTAGGVKKFDNQIGDIFYLIYGDILSMVDYSKMSETFLGKTPDALGMQTVKKANDYEDADVAEIDADGMFVKIHPKPHVEKYDNAYRMRGVFILRKKILSYIPSDTYYEIGKNLLPDIVGRGEKFYGYECEDYSKGIDTLDKREEVENYLKSLRVK